MPEDLRVREGRSNISMSERKDGPRLLRHLKMNKRTVFSILRWTGNTVVMSPRPRFLVSTRAAEFCSSWGLFRVSFGRPETRVLQ